LNSASRLSRVAISRSVFRAYCWSLEDRYPARGAFASKMKRSDRSSSIERSAGRVPSWPRFRRIFESFH
jgi:hypothetical protein